MNDCKKENRSQDILCKRLRKDMLQISFLPWVKLDKAVKLGPITFWPYYSEVEQKGIATTVKTHLDKYFNCYVNCQGKPVDTITVCSYEDNNFRILDDFKRHNLRSVVDAVIFIAIATAVERGVCLDNDSFGPPSADVFELVTQNFAPGNDHISVQAGSVCHTGWNIGDITFPKPLATGSPFWNLEGELVEGFDKCWTVGFPEDVRKRLLHSLEWFRMAHVEEGGQISEITKIVMMATAFEILLQFPKDGKRKYFANYMEKHIASEDFLTDTRSIGKEKVSKWSLAGCWAWDFYDLRNRIVHGDRISSSDLIYRDWLTNFIVADLVFEECIKRELFDNECIGSNARSAAKKFNEILPDESEGTIANHSCSWFLGFDPIHRALGWLPEIPITANDWRKVGTKRKILTDRKVS